MLFLMKKWVGGLLMPLPLLLMFFAFALILLFFTRRQTTAKILLTVTFVSLSTLSLMPVSEQMAHSLEQKHPPLIKQQTQQNFDYILLLGSSSIADPDLPVTGQLSATALSRFIEALRLYHANPDSILIVSGSAFGDLKSHAQLLQELALSMGVSENRIIRLDDTLDTDDEARQMSEIIRGKKAVLVTSATHMDRALKLFVKYGELPVPAPANYLAKQRFGDIPSYYYIPSAHNLYKSKVAWHEYLGRWLNTLKDIWQ